MKTSPIDCYLIPSGKLLTCNLIYISYVISTNDQHYVKNNAADFTLTTFTTAIRISNLLVYLSINVLALQIH